MALNGSALAHAGQLAPVNVSSLSDAKFVVLGKVTATTYGQIKFADAMDVAIIEVLKGKIATSILKSPVDKNPISGFDLLLNKGDVAEEGKADLFAPGACATLSKEYFK